MNILIIQENGRHAANRGFRECHSLHWAFRQLGNKTQVWGLGHESYADRPDFNAFDLILNLENYDEQGWLPDLSMFEKPRKMLWAVDEHVRGLEYYRRLDARDRYHVVLHSTRDYVCFESDKWLPNAADPLLLRPLNLVKRCTVGFCGHVNNRKPWLDLLERNFEFQADIGVIGYSMVRAINSYDIAFNRNIANDINARSFEVIACGVPLATNTNDQYGDLGFVHLENCLFYESEDDLLNGLLKLREDHVARKRIAQNGFRLSQMHTYLERAKSILRTLDSIPRRACASAQIESATGRTEKSTTAPVVSICIITNSGLPGKSERQQYLERLLQSLVISGLVRPEVEVIIAGAVPEGLANIKRIDLAEMAAKGEVCAMRNECVKVSSGDIILHCDDDLVFAPGYWDAIFPMFRIGWDILCPRLLNPNGTRYWDWAAYVPGKGQTLLPYDVHHPYAFATGGHALYRRTVFSQVSWSQNLRHGDNEEWDFARQARVAGLKYLPCPSATAYLQFHHCDAMAVCHRLKQENTESECEAFKAILARLGGSTQRPQHGLSATGRFEHKLVGPASPQLPTVSILVMCFRYLQRFRVFARSIIAQNYPLERVEVIVANPNSPDGLGKYLSILNRACQANGPNFKTVTVDPGHYRNRGYGIQRAFESSKGEIVLGMDCDLVLPADFLSVVATVSWQRSDVVVGVYRNFLTSATTDRIIAGVLDPLKEFQSLLSEDTEEEQGYRGVLGYCQSSARKNWEAAGYPEHFDNIAKSDVEFVERLGKIGVKPHFLPDVRVLHLHHPRNWEGTADFL